MRSILWSGGRLPNQQRRRGVFFVLVVVSLMAAMTFVGMSVDLGMITVTKTRMQGAADAAALGAAQEIVIGIREAGEQGVTDFAEVQALAAQAARDMAVGICERNGFSIIPETDVRLGRRLLAEDGGSYVEIWDSPPYNMVRVEIRKTNPDVSADDGKLPLIFAPVQGDRAHALRASAVAFIESRDIVAVLDYSGSMTFDSQFRNLTVNRMGLNRVENSLDAIWDALVNSGVRFSDDPDIQKFPENGLGAIDSYDGTSLSSSDTDEIFEALQLDNAGPVTDSSGVLVKGESPEGDSDSYIEMSFYPTEVEVASTKDLSNVVLEFEDGSHQKFEGLGSVHARAFAGTGVHSGKKIQRAWVKSGTNGSGDGPGYGERFNATYVTFPQGGKTGRGFLKGRPSESQSRAQWHSYIDYVKNNLGSYGYQKRYGYRTLVHYLLSERKYNKHSEDLWRAPVYPHHAMKEGMTMFTTFLDNLGYSDQLGLVTYASTSRIETGIDDDGATTHVDLAGDHITSRIMDIDTIQRQKQAGHYGHQMTGIGYALEDAAQLLQDHGRYGARKTVVLMTDGQSNQHPNGWDSSSLPEGWDWNEITDFDGDGTADLVIDSTYDGGGNQDGNWKAALHSFVRAREAYEAGCTIHAISAGDGADTVLMHAIAQMSGGEYVHIPSGATNEQMETDLEAAFAVMAGQVPPARLVIAGD